MKICGHYGSEVNPQGYRCYGPQGFIRDIWAAVDYRPAIEELLDNDCAPRTRSDARYATRAERRMLTDRP